MKRFFVAFTVTILLAGSSFAVGSLGIGDVTVEDSLVIVPIILGGDVGSGVSSLNFTLNYDPAVVEPVSAAPGAAAMAADKKIMMNVPQPGLLILAVVGFNQTVIQPGEVAKVTMRRVTSDAAVMNLGVVDPSFSSREGTTLESRATPFAGFSFGATSKDDKPKTDESDRRPPKEDKTPVPGGTTSDDPAGQEDKSGASPSPAVAGPGEPAGAVAGKGDPAAKVADALGKLAVTRDQIPSPVTGEDAQTTRVDAPTGTDTTDESAEPTDEVALSDGQTASNTVAVARVVPPDVVGAPGERAGSGTRTLQPGSDKNVKSRTRAGVGVAIVGGCILLGGGIIVLGLKRLR